MDDIRYQPFISCAFDNNLPSSLPGSDGSRRGWVQVFYDELNRELVANLSRKPRQDRRGPRPIADIRGTVHGS